MSPEGVRMEVRPDGSSTRVMPDGTRVDSKPDGGAKLGGAQAGDEPDSGEPAQLIGALAGAPDGPLPEAALLERDHDANESDEEDLRKRLEGWGTAEEVGR